MMKEWSKSLVLACLVAVVAAGCATTETVKQAEGQGASRVYAYPYDPVFNAALAAASSKKLEVLESDRNSGRIVLSHGITLWSWGERIALFVKPVTSRSTQVEIVSRPILAPLNFPPDWQRILLDEVETSLRSGS